MVSSICYQVVSLVPEGDYSLASVSVRLKKEYVERYRQESAYVVLNDIDVGDLQTHVAPLVANDEEDSDALRFDALMYGFMEPGELTKAPFDRPYSFMKLFDTKQQMQLVATIRRVKENATTPAA